VELHQKIIIIIRVLGNDFATRILQFTRRIFSKDADNKTYYNIKEAVEMDMDMVVKGVSPHTSLSF